VRAAPRETCLFWPTVGAMAHDITVSLTLSDNGDAAQLVGEVAAGKRASVDLEGTDRRSGTPVTVRVYP
jgi:hypothetical protein